MTFDARLAFGSLALVLVTFASGCSSTIGGNPANVDVGCGIPAPATTITPTADPTTTASRLPATCGSAAYQPGDTLSMDVEFPGSQGASLTMTFPAAVNTNQSIPLVVAAVNAQGLYAAQGAGADSAISFLYAPGITSAIDSTALQAVMLDVSALPSADGDPLAVIVTLEFADGKQLTQDYSAPTTTPPQACIGPAADGGTT
jgi:hypothetical protein